MIIGTMKSGTTTLFRWLGTHPRVQLPTVKEPNFFSDDRRWNRGKEWYATHFESVAADVLTGESSVSYTDPSNSAVAAERVKTVLPEARLICLLRNPVDRLKSHYRHEVQRGRERRTFIEAIADQSSPYVLRSHYSLALDPWVQRFPTEQLHVVRFEDLFSEEEYEWNRLLGFLELDHIAQPTTAHNLTADKAGFSPVMKVMWDTGLIQRLPRQPRVIRRLARRLLLRHPETRSGLNDSADAPMPLPVLEALNADLGRLRKLRPDVLGWDLADR